MKSWGENLNDQNPHYLYEHDDGGGDDDVVAVVVDVLMNQHNVNLTRIPQNQNCCVVVVAVVAVVD